MARSLIDDDIELTLSLRDRLELAQGMGITPRPDDRLAGRTRLGVLSAVWIDRRGPHAVVSAKTAKDNDHFAPC